MDVAQVHVSGKDVVIVNSIAGTHTGPLTTEDGKVVAPTHKKFVQEQMTHVVLNDSGKVQSLRAYGNPADLYVQLGLSK
jgi:hypothetical protein